MNWGFASVILIWLKFKITFAFDERYVSLKLNFWQRANIYTKKNRANHAELFINVMHHYWENMRVKIKEW